MRADFLRNLLSDTPATKDNAMRPEPSIVVVVPPGVDHADLIDSISKQAAAIIESFRDEACTAAERPLPAGIDVGRENGRAVVVSYFCNGCGHSTPDPAADLAALQAAGHRACCPERKMVPVAMPREPARTGLVKMQLAYDIELRNNGGDRALAFRAAYFVMRSIFENEARRAAAAAAAAAE